MLAIAIGLLLSLIPEGSIGLWTHPDDLVPIPLCRALETLNPGDKIPVIVSGVYVPATSTYQYFYDPEEQHCRFQVQDYTCVEFAPGVVFPPGFESLRDEGLRDEAEVHILVTFRGVLYGPPHPSSVDPRAPSDSPIARLVNRFGRNHYCEGSNRFNFVVEEILSFRRAPGDLPVSGGYETAIEPPMPIQMELPGYPIPAHMIGYEGAVILAVSVVDGKVTKVGVQYGDPSVIHEAFANVQTWRFADDVSTRFVVKYDFRLETRAANEDSNPAYEMRLPSYIRVTGPNDMKRE